MCAGCDCGYYGEVEPQTNCSFSVANEDIRKRVVGVVFPTVELLDDDFVYVYVSFWNGLEPRIDVKISSKRAYPKYKAHRAVNIPWLKARVKGYSAVEHVLREMTR